MLGFLNKKNVLFAYKCLVKAWPYVKKWFTVNRQKRLRIAGEVLKIVLLIVNLVLSSYILYVIQGRV